MIKFILKKVANISFIDLLFLEFESYIQFIFNLIPGNFGLIVRGFAYKNLLFQTKNFPYVQQNNIFVHSRKIKIGKNLLISPFCYINGIGKITFGNNVIIGPSVVISSGEHVIYNISTPIATNPTTLKEIVIEDDVWIGANVTILPGLRIGKGSVIGANSVVTKNTEAGGVYVGTPAKLIKFRI